MKPMTSPDPSHSFIETAFLFATVFVGKLFLNAEIDVTTLVHDLSNVVIAIAGIIVAILGFFRTIHEAKKMRDRKNKKLDTDFILDELDKLKKEVDKYKKP